MAGLLTSLIGTLPLPRSRSRLDTCAVCGNGVHEGDARMRLPGGGWVHRGCSTYRMRRRESVRRRARINQ